MTMKAIVDVQELRIVEADDAAPPGASRHAEVVIIGGGLGGVAAALSAGAAGRTVILVEETDWLGGQATSQGVSALDENGWIEASGGTRSYLAFRRGIRDWYRRNTTLTPAAAGKEHLNPGNGWVSRLCFEPKAALAVIDEMLAPAAQSGHLSILKRHKAYAVGRSGEKIEHVDVVNLETRERTRLTGGMFIDASELGDLLALRAAEFTSGADARSQTGEPGAVETADPLDVQSFTYPFAIENRPGEQHLIARPADYERNHEKQPYTLVIHYHDRGDRLYGMFVKGQGYGPFWTYRRLIDHTQFAPSSYRNDIAMINWPGNDYRGGSILVDSPQEQIRHLRAARNLSLGLLYWLQTEVARDEGGRGYPEFKLRPDVMGSADGISKFPYIRETRRLVALRTIVQQDVSSGTQKGPRAEHFRDSVGIGHYSIDIHETTRSSGQQVMTPTKPFQIPLGALIPRKVTNLLAGNKNLGVTHITNGCYRLHPIEWNVGEAAGTAAAMAIERGAAPRRIRDDAALLLDLQRRLVARGVPLMWYDDVPVSDDRFERVHLAPFEKPETLEQLRGDLHAPRPA